MTLCLFVGSENLGIGRVNERVFIWSFEIKRKVRRKMRGKWVGNKERQRERGRFFCFVLGVLFCLIVTCWDFWPTQGKERSKMGNY